MTPKYPQVKCKLTGKNGNVYVIIGAVSTAMKAAGLHKEAEEFNEAAINSGSYDAVLRLCMKTVDVT